MLLMFVPVEPFWVLFTFARTATAGASSTLMGRAPAEEADAASGNGGESV